MLPLTGQSRRSAPRLLGGRTRAALEREKTLVLRSIKELEFDRAMGKVSEKDFAEMGGAAARAGGRLMRQLDAGAGYREQIEKEIAKRSGGAGCRGRGERRVYDARPALARRRLADDARAHRAERATTPTRGSASTAAHALEARA